MAVDIEDRIEVVKEPLTYERHAPFSMFKDMVDAERGDYSASERLKRHSAEVEVETRANPDRTAGQGGYFAPPLWLIDAFATAPRPARVLANLIPNFELPAGVQSVNLPRLTTGTSTLPEADLSPVSDTDVVDTSVASEVVTIAGEADVSLQLLDQSPPGAHLDHMFLKDLNEAYDAQLELQLLNGTGTAPQLLGLLNVTGIGAVTYTSASPVATGMYTSLGKTIAALSDVRKLPPEVWLMTTSRMAWLGSGEDQQNRPLMLTDKDGSGKFDLLAFEVALTDAMPTTLGAGANQDAVIACRPSDMMLFESAPHARVHLEPLSGTLGARIQLHRYVAAMTGRYPSAIAAMTGTGLVVQSGF